MTEFPWREVETVAGPVADASAALASALPWWRADAGARLVLERLGAGQVVVEVVAVAGSAVGSDAVAPAGGDAVALGQDAEVLLLEAAGGGVVAGLWLDPVFTQLLVARLLLLLFHRDHCAHDKSFRNFRKPRYNISQLSHYLVCPDVV